MRFLHLIQPVMWMLPEVDTPDRKVGNGLRGRLEKGMDMCGGGVVLR